MKLVERFWYAVSYLGSILTLSPFHELAKQTPLAATLNVPGDPNFPVFKPPSGLEGDGFQCLYPEMVGWEDCSHETNTCWLKHPNGSRFDINTDYEFNAPRGVHRYYSLNMTDSWYAADGLNFDRAKLFNDTYPGPWIQGCWGDTIHVNVTNLMEDNGTSVHWHGIRQNQTMHMDGVNGITQCPIAPGDSFEYVFKAVQYGSSWYHSHYSVQYADGAAGPLTLHGPSSADYDEPRKPLIMTDWAHITAFFLVTNFSNPGDPDILVNGRGSISQYSGKAADPDHPIKPFYNITFEPKRPGKRAKRYLLRVINTSFDTTFTFSIDHHKFQVIAADFVPIKPYWAHAITVGIGQRYHIIVEADPIPYTYENLPVDGNYWIRTGIPPGCLGSPGTVDGWDGTAVIRYNPKSTADPCTKHWMNIPSKCADEPYESLVPILPWTVKPPSNSNNSHGETFDVQGFNRSFGTPKFPIAKFSLETRWPNPNPLQVDYPEPIFLELNNFTKQWPRSWAVVPEDYTDKDWVYLVISGTAGGSQAKAHPMHLHGHDFAILEQKQNTTWDPMKFNWTRSWDNPPRRDVVLLPDSGYVVMAFKADNPGAWLIHCHIAFHASWGLGMQVLERQADANKLWPHPDDKDIVEAQRVCTNWKDWVKKQKHFFQDDSGI